MAADIIPNIWQDYLNITTDFIIPVFLFSLTRVLYRVIIMFLNDNRIN